MKKADNCPSCNSVKLDNFLSSKDYFLTQEDFDLIKCENCGLLITSPIPEENELTKYYQSTEYLSHDVSNKKLLTRVYKAVRKYTIKNKLSIINHFTEGNEILDIGCGTGEFLNLCKQNGFNVHGIEPNKIPREFGNKVYQLDIHENFSDFILAGKSFDCITLWHVLEHIHGLNETIEKLRKLLKKEGVLIIALPNSNSWDASHYGKFWAGYDLPRHLYHFNIGSFKFAVEKHSFSILQIIPQKFDAFYVSILSEKYQNGKNRIVQALLNGLFSNYHAIRSKKGYSSLIFILKIKKP